jgi:hypothetical protein
MVNKIDQALEQPDQNNLFPSEIHLTYDSHDGKIFCAFVNKEKCEQDAKESGCTMKTVNLITKE